MWNMIFIKNKPKIYISLKRSINILDRRSSRQKSQEISFRYPNAQINLTSNEKRIANTRRLFNSAVKGRNYCEIRLDIDILESIG